MRSINSFRCDRISIASQLNGNHYAKIRLLAQHGRNLAAGILQVYEQRAKAFELCGGEIDKANTKTHGWHLVRYFAAQLKPFAVLKLQFDIENFPYLGSTEAIDITAALG